MMKVAGIRSDKEAANFLLGKVGEPYITAYIHHVTRERRPGHRGMRAQHAIIPDILAYNLPTGRQVVDDSGAHCTAEAIFEVKTFTHCPTHYNHNHSSIKPADRRANTVSQEYARKFRKLDEIFAPDVISGENAAAIGPFTAAQSRFFSGQVVPLCAGWFGDLNKDFEKIILKIARTAATSDDGLSISPLVNYDRKGGAFPIMLQQFRRAVGISAVRGNAQLKLTRLHYVRGTAAEARATCNANHSDFRSNPGYSGAGARWYSDHVPEGYSTFAQFVNGYEYYVP